MNLWFVCLIDKSLSIFLGSSTILHPCGYRLVREGVPAVSGLRALDCTAWPQPTTHFPSQEKLSVGEHKVASLHLLRWARVMVIVPLLEGLCVCNGSPFINYHPRLLAPTPVQQREDGITLNSPDRIRTIVWNVNQLSMAERVESDGQRQLDRMTDQELSITRSGHVPVVSLFPSKWYPKNGPCYQRRGSVGQQKKKSGSNWGNCLKILRSFMFYVSRGRTIEGGMVFVRLDARIEWLLAGAGEEAPPPGNATKFCNADISREGGGVSELGEQPLISLEIHGERDSHRLSLWTMSCWLGQGRGGGQNWVAEFFDFAQFNLSVSFFNRKSFNKMLLNNSCQIDTNLCVSPGSSSIAKLHNEMSFLLPSRSSRLGGWVADGPTVCLYASTGVWQDRGWIVLFKFGAFDAEWW